MDIVKIARGLVAPGCDPFPTVNFLVRSGLATAVLWRLWLAPFAAFLDSHSRADGDILIDLGFAALLLALVGAAASVASLVVGEFWGS